MNFDEKLAQFEHSLGLPSGFIARLRDDGDDWSFIIKAHALIETGLTEMLIQRLGHPELASMLALLPINGQVSKLAFSEALELLPDDPGETQKFIKALGTLRNRLVHSIKRGVDFSLVRYFHELNADKFNTEYSALDLVFRDTKERIQIADRKLTSREFFRERPRYIIGIGLGIVLCGLHDLSVIVKVSSEMRRAADELFTQLVRDELAAKVASSQPATKD